MPIDLNALLYRVVDMGASDLHLKVGIFPIARVDGRLTPFHVHLRLNH